MSESPSSPRSDEVRRFAAASPVEDIRMFLLSQAGQALPAGSQDDAAIRVTIRVLSNEVEVDVRPPGDVRPTTGRFADWFRGQLREQNLTQQAAAHRLGVSGKTVNRWVQGHTEPRMRELRRVQEVFGDLPTL